MKSRAKVKLGKGCSISSRAILGYEEHGGEIVIGDHVSIRHEAILRTCTGRIEVGDNVSIGYYVIIHAKGGVSIGRDTLVSPRVQIYAQNHGLKLGLPIREQPQSSEGVTIGSDCWVGAGAIICDGVVIEDGVVIGAGAVCPKGRYVSQKIYAGNPARIVGERQ